MDILTIKCGSFRLRRIILKLHKKVALLLHEQKMFQDQIALNVFRKGSFNPPFLSNHHEYNVFYHEYHVFHYKYQTCHHTSFIANLCVTSSFYSQDANAATNSSIPANLQKDRSRKPDTDDNQQWFFSAAAIILQVRLSLPMVITSASLLHFQLTFCDILHVEVIKNGLLQNWGTARLFECKMLWRILATAAARKKFYFPQSSLLC